MLQMSCVPSFTSASLQKKLFIVDNPKWTKVILTLKNMKVVMNNNEYKFNLENLVCSKQIANLVCIDNEHYISKFYPINHITYI